MAFQRIFQQTDVAQSLQLGLQALGQYSRLIQCNTPNQIEGSVDIDSCLMARFPNDNRWDYAFGWNNIIYYIEVHHVSDSEVHTMINKYRWLCDWRNRQPNPHELKRNSNVYWINSHNGGSITKNSKYIRMLSTAGIPPPRKNLQL